MAMTQKTIQILIGVILIVSTFSIIGYFLYKTDDKDELTVYAYESFLAWVGEPRGVAAGLSFYFTEKDSTARSKAEAYASD